MSLAAQYVSGGMSSANLLLNINKSDEGGSRTLCGCAAA